jgi:transcriptional regulator of arginine metabolism
MSKVQRQQAIVRLLGARGVSNQPQLVELLSAEGLIVTQATVSRDLEDLGAIKVRVGGGDTVYAIPEYEPERIAPNDQLRRVLGEWVAEVKQSGHLVVLRTPPGCAHVVASALDRSNHPGLLGTVAGDDTLLCIADEQFGGRRLAELLRDLAGLTASPAEPPAPSSGSDPAASKTAKGAAKPSAARRR